MDHNIAPNFRIRFIGLLTLVGLTLWACTAASGSDGASSPTPTALTPGLTPLLGQQDVTYDEALDLAIQQNDPDQCSLITVEVRQDFIAPIVELIDECQAQFAVATRNLDYCLTLKQKPKGVTGTRT